MDRIVALALFTLASCAGAPRGPAGPGPVDRSCHSVPNPAPYMTTLHGTVLDRQRHPLAGATVQLVRWRDADDHGQWERTEPVAQTTADDHGVYVLTTSEGSYQIEARAAGGTAIGVGYRADRPTRQLDITVEPGVVRVFDAAILDLAFCDDSCPRDRAPPDEWWLQPSPCPTSARLAIERDAQHGSVTIACRDERGGHGAYTRWLQTHDGWLRKSGWLKHGQPCGESVDPQPLPQPLAH